MVKLHYNRLRYNRFSVTTGFLALTESLLISICEWLCL